MPSGLVPRRQHMGSLSAQPRHTTADRLTLCHRGVRYRCVGASLVENALRHGPSVRMILAGFPGDGRNSDVRRRGRPQGFPATIHG
jgi:hypothetical protein